MSIRLNQVGNKAGKIAATVRNAEASASIPRGTPVILNLSTTTDNTKDGLDVVLPSTAGAAVGYLGRFGIITDTTAVGQQSEAILFGVATYAIFTRMTRAASSDSWTSSASLASGIACGVDTLNNALLLVGASVAASIATNHMDYALLDSVASAAASATATSDTRTAITSSARAFVRML